ncbi:S1 RNA-binding domain-containing protein [Thermodesulfobacterium hydrogeniphilum]|uniref:S1 RNA-binding domain-containing protein n=1 Tax=Thermodesulfobacterium hydrogeniphilum TaxID=161156 RepID=UPI00056FF598|nr:S1 RNA-binding domain-containing protein [Thermodesulfobacterium hydrogeniphilum]
MENWVQELENYLNKFSADISIGSVVSGKVVKISEDYVFIDIGLKGEALLPVSDVKTEEGNLLIKEDDHIQALVVGRSQSDGSFILSFKRLKEKELWEEIKNFFKEKKSIMVKVISEIKGGYQVKYKELITGFLPYSQSYFRKKTETSQELVGKVLEVDILKIENRSFIVSRRKLLEREYKKKKENLIEKIKKESVLEGSVKDVIKGGFLVDLEGVLTGYLPFKELSWQKLDDPKNYLKKGDKIRVKVISFDPVKERIKLSIKALIPDPWEKVGEKYQEGQKVRGKITKIFNFGAFLEVEPGVEGLIPKSEITWNKKVKIEEVLKEGDLVEALIFDLRPSERKMLLSLRKLEPSPWEKLASEVKVGDIISGKIKNIIDFGIFVEIKEGIDGFIHISNISWNRIEDLSKVFNEGEEIQAKVLEIDPEKRRLQLSLKHLKPDPMEEVLKKYKVGDVLEGVIKKVLSTGLIVEILPEVQAFIPLKELIEDSTKFKKSDKLLENYKEGEKIKGKIILLDQEKRRIHLSYQRYLKDLENKEIEAYKVYFQKTTGITLGELLSKKLKIN